MLQALTSAYTFGPVVHSKKRAKMTGRILTSKCFILRLWNGKTLLEHVLINIGWWVFLRSKFQSFPWDMTSNLMCERCWVQLPLFCRVFPHRWGKFWNFDASEANAATLGSQMLVSWRSWCLTASQPACPPNATPSAIKGLDQAFFRRNYWFIINALNKASFYFRGKLCWGDRFMAGHFEGWEGEMFSLFRDMLSFRSCF